MPELPLASPFLKFLAVYIPSSLYSLHPYLEVHSSLGSRASFPRMLGSCMCFQHIHFQTMAVNKSLGTTIINRALHGREYFYIYCFLMLFYPPLAKDLIVVRCSVIY